MVIEGGTNTQTGTYTANNGFTTFPVTITNASGIDGHKTATGAAETPSVTHSTTSNRQVLLGFVANVAPDLPPAAPTGLSSTSAISTIFLDWNNNTEPDLAGYNVYRSTTSGSGYVLLNGSLLSSSDYADANVTNDTTYYYVVTAVDAAGFESVYSSELAAAPSTPAVGTGAITHEWWSNIGGTQTGDLTSDVNYPDNPSGVQLLTKLEGPVNWDDNYGSRIYGYLNPVTTGDYIFWIASSDSSNLYLSTDTNPGNIEWIAYVGGATGSREWNKYESQQSWPISLVAGQKYYIMVEHKASGGNDNVAVAWEGPGITQQVIDGIYLSPCGLKFLEFAGFAAQWGRTDCDSSNDWCSGGDFNRDGTVGIDDLAAFADGWLAGI
jgi:hypothetical protein